MSECGSVNFVVAYRLIKGHFSAIRVLKRHILARFGIVSRHSDLGQRSEVTRVVKILQKKCAIIINVAYIFLSFELLCQSGLYSTS